MIEMNPYYAHDSSVGPVFDVATWSRRKAATLGCGAVVFGLLGIGLLVVCFKPDLFLDKPPKVVRQIHSETQRMVRTHAAGTYAVTGVVGVGIYCAFATGFAFFHDLSAANYFFRIGRGGMSVRVPNGLDPMKAFLSQKILRMDLPFEQIADWKIVQHKQVGSLSRNTGNKTAYVNIKLIDGQRRSFFLDLFREPAHVIKSKIDSALQMVPADLTATAGTPTDKSGRPESNGYRLPTQPVVTLEAKYEAITNALEHLSGLTSSSPTVIFSDAETENFVQFARPHQAYLLDLPRQALSPEQWARAETYFDKLPATLSDEATPEQGGAAVAVTPDTGFQLALADVDETARITLEVFLRVYQLPTEFDMKVEFLT